MNGNKLLLALSQRIAQIGADEALNLLTNRKTIFLDVRDSHELHNGAIPNGLHISRGFLEMKVEEIIPDKNSPIIVYCAGGVRSLFAADTLKNLGYQLVQSLDGGYSKWKEKGHPTVRRQLLNPDLQSRYARHLTLKEIGEAGQIQLLNSKVLVIGAGGLGSPCLFYLAAAGVGTIGVLDFDVVDESNLQRQILHSNKNIGALKVESAIEALSRFNPYVKLVPHNLRLEAGNIESIIANYDIIVDGSDNFNTRYLVNDACYKMKIPLVHGSILSFEGQLTLFDFTQDSPCYRCLFPEPPLNEFAPNCSQAGVLGALPGVIGTLQSVETIKTLLKIGSPMSGRLLHFDALTTEFSEFPILKNKSCITCSKDRSSIHLRNEVDACNL